MFAVNWLVAPMEVEVQDRIPCWDPNRVSKPQLWGRRNKGRALLKPLLFILTEGLRERENYFKISTGYVLV